MTTGPDNLGNGAAKTEDRFAGQLGYRPRGSRDGGSLPAGRPTNGPHDGPLNGSLGGPISGGGTRMNGNRNGSALNGSSLSNPLDPGPLGSPLDGTGLPELAAPIHTENLIASTLTEPKLPDTDPVESDLSFRDSSNLMASDSWLESAGKDVVDHPLLRGLLLELPPKGSTMQVQWLDRWFEAARSILELLYRFEGKRD
ncbi:hypothetical protein GCM10009557_17540 [Virgisporangium ochraceum]|uniref:Uncharacterized protein n=1 Tax=Virgisporangium ochraceum TaxID=65505 RepID=A0A8J3ZNU6_9ACTN|nr:hypothetical protein [Virgisporangium ochraceum]GIJ66337.1 hypothetical protein Voc01_012540 [Virgisporangium ochraceum]